MKLQEIIKKARISQNMTMLTLSNLSGIDQALLSKYESGQRIPSEAHIQNLSRALEIPYTEIRTAYITEKIYEIIQFEETAKEALQAAEARIEYLSSKQVFKLQQIHSSVQEKLQIADTLREVWLSKKPLNATQLHKMKEYFALKYTFESNRIEGNTLTLQETQLVVNEGITIGGKSMREHLEAINHSEAIDFVSTMLVGKEEISQRNVLEIHRLILKSIDNENAGTYRKVQVRISGSEHVPPDWLLVPQMMNDFFTHYKKQKKKLHPILLAAEMHERLVTIHPFIDGNGRTARLLMNCILLQHGYTIAIVKGDSDAKKQYYNALEQVQIHNNPNTFYELIVQNVIQSLQEHIELT
ncbi:MAG TPA: Fic family protein [Bacteroidales bacterium]|nr:Fic family protein [Bacteroidales bacterium]